jgi:hypothetical protein
LSTSIGFVIHDHGCILMARSNVMELGQVTHHPSMQQRPLHDHHHAMMGGLRAYTMFVSACVGGAAVHDGARCV